MNNPPSASVQSDCKLEKASGKFENKMADANAGQQQSKNQKRRKKKQEQKRLLKQQQQQQQQILLQLQQEQQALLEKQEQQQREQQLKRQQEALVAKFTKANGDKAERNNTAGARSLKLRKLKNQNVEDKLINRQPQSQLQLQLQPQPKTQANFGNKKLNAGQRRAMANKNGNGQKKSESVEHYCKKLEKISELKQLIVNELENNELSRENNGMNAMEKRVKQHEFLKHLQSMGNELGIANLVDFNSDIHKEHHRGPGSGGEPLSFLNLGEINFDDNAEEQQQLQQKKESPVYSNEPVSFLNQQCLICQSNLEIIEIFISGCGARCCNHDSESKSAVTECADTNQKCCICDTDLKLPSTLNADCTPCSTTRKDAGPAVNVTADNNLAAKECMPAIDSNKFIDIKAITDENQSLIKKNNIEQIVKNAAVKKDALKQAIAEREEKAAPINTRTFFLPYEDIRLLEDGTKTIRLTPNLIMEITKRSDPTHADWISTTCTLKFKLMKPADTSFFGCKVLPDSKNSKDLPQGHTVLKVPKAKPYLNNDGVPHELINLNYHTKSKRNRNVVFAKERGYTLTIDVDIDPNDIYKQVGVMKYWNTNEGCRMIPIRKEFGICHRALRLFSLTFIAFERTTDVYYRRHMPKKCRQWELTGWAKFLADSNLIQGLLEGFAPNLKSFINWIKKRGCSAKYPPSEIVSWSEFHEIKMRSYDEFVILNFRNQSDRLREKEKDLHRAAELLFAEIADCLSDTDEDTDEDDKNQEKQEKKEEKKEEKEEKEEEEKEEKKNEMQQLNIMPQLKLNDESAVNITNCEDNGDLPNPVADNKVDDLSYKLKNWTITSLPNFDMCTKESQPLKAENDKDDKDAEMKAETQAKTADEKMDPPKLPKWTNLFESAAEIFALVKIVKSIPKRSDKQKKPAKAAKYKYEMMRGGISPMGNAQHNENLKRNLAELCNDNPPNEN